MNTLLIYLGNVGQARRHDWKLLRWTQFRCPQLIVKAVDLAIYDSFREACERYVLQNQHNNRPDMLRIQ